MAIRSNTNIVVHVTFSTKNRRPLLPSSTDSGLESFWKLKCGELRCHLLEFGAAEDHVHLLLRIPATESVSTVVGRLKGACSHWWNSFAQRPHDLYWTDGYFAESCHPHSLEEIRSYVRNQRARHAAGQVRTELEPDCTPPVSTEGAAHTLSAAWNATAKRQVGGDIKAGA